MAQHIGSNKRRMLHLLAVTTLLQGCASRAPVYNASPVSAAATAPTNPCAFLPLKSYSATLNAGLAAEVEQAPATAIWPGVLADYVSLRDAVRACVKP